MSKLNSDYGEGQNLHLLVIYHNGHDQFGANRAGVYSGLGPARGKATTHSPGKAYVIYRMEHATNATKLVWVEAGVTGRKPK